MMLAACLFLIVSAIDLVCHKGPQTRGVVLLVADMDETITVQTFTPGGSPRVLYGADGFQGLRRYGEDFLEQLRAANFGTVERHEELKAMLGSLQAQGVELIVMTFNEAGPLPVLNILRIGGLDKYFAAVYGLPGRNRPAGMVRVRVNGGADGVDYGWISSEQTKVSRDGTLLVDPNGDADRFGQPVFETPLTAFAPRTDGAKADAMKKILGAPASYLPQSAAVARITNAEGSLSAALLLDDKQENRETSNGEELPNFCLVKTTGSGSRRSGGIAAGTVRDFEELQRSFPWGPATEEGALVRRLIAEHGGWQ